MFAVSVSGALLGTYRFDGAGAFDWEDIAVGPGPEAGKSYLYLGDIGDNIEFRPDVTIYRVQEPAVSLTPQSPPTETLTGVEALKLAYPDRAHNAETLLVDPVNGDLYIVAKAETGQSPVFRAAASQLKSSEDAIKMEQVAELNFAEEPLSGKLTTGGDISASGDSIAIRTYESAFLWRRVSGGTIAQALATEPCLIPLAIEEQGEALGFATDGRGYYTVSEGKDKAISYYEKL